MYPGVEEIGVKCLYPGCDNLLHVGICCKSLALYVLLKGPKDMEIIGSWIANSTCDRLQRYGWEVTDRTLCSPDLAPSDFSLFGPLTKHLVQE